jgi:hypothetical protein
MTNQPPLRLPYGVADFVKLRRGNEYNGAWLPLERPEAQQDAGALEFAPTRRVEREVRGCPQCVVTDPVVASGESESRLRT